MKVSAERYGNRRTPGIPALFTTLVLAIGGQARSQDKHATSAISWFEEFEKGVENARREKKLLLVHFGAEWCSWCRKMEADTFADPKVAAVLAQGFVSVSVDVDRKKELVKKYLVERVPTTLVLLPEGNPVEMLDGYVPDAEFSGWLESWRAAWERLRQADEAVAEKPGDREAACRRAEALLRLNQPARAKKVIETVLALFPEDAASGAAERKFKAELLVHLGDAALVLLEPPKRILEIAGRIEAVDPGGTLGFEVHALFLRAAADDMLSHELEEDAVELERVGKKGQAAKRRAEARKLQAGVLSRLEECARKFPENPRGDAVLVWTGHLLLEVRKNAAGARKLFQQVLDQYPDSDFADEARQRLRDMGGDTPKSDRKDKKP